MKTYLEADIGAMVRKKRIAHGLSMEDVADRASISPTSVRSLEHGRGTTLTTLLKVLEEIGETSLFTDWIAKGNSFSPIAVLREEQHLPKERKRVSRKRTTENKGGFPYE
jgi:transcriptional regulator with XRE-family HTH domain